MAKKEITKDDYRSERKERLAKAAKKSKKSHIDSTKVVSTVIAIICVVAVLASIGGGLYVYGVPQRFIPAVKINGRNYSIAEYNYYYSSVYQTYANQAYSVYSTYGFSLGFDHTADPAAQTTKDEDDKEITYAEFFRNNVVETIEQYNYYLGKAQEEGITLSEEHTAEVEATISEIATYAAQAGYSTDRYISTLYGKGLNEKTFRKLLNEQSLVAQYLEKVEDELYEGIELDEIEKTYDESPADYQVVDLRIFGFAIEDEEETTEAKETTAAEETTEAEETTAAEETTVAEETTKVEEATNNTEETTKVEETTKAEETKKEPTKYELLAQEMMNKVTDEASFIELAREYCSEEEAATFKDDNATLALGISKSTVTSNFDEDLAEWLFSEERKAGDTTTCSSDEYVYVVFVKAPAYKVETPLVDARHILSSFETIAEEMAKDNDSKVNTKESDDHEIKTVTASDGAKITNEGTKYSIDVVLKAYEESLKVYKAFKDHEYEEGETPEEVFGTFATEYSNDSAEEGLYEGIQKGQMVKPFEEWVYDEKREPGDVEMIMTTYGWHIMYFVEKHEEAAWIENIREQLSAEKLEKEEAEVKTLTNRTAKETAFEDIAYKLSLKHVNDKLVSSK